MKEQLITFKTAKLAKEKHFFVRVKHYYNTENPLGFHKLSPPILKHPWSVDDFIGSTYTDMHGDSKFLKYQIDTYVNAPTQSLLQKWLREEHGIDMNLNKDSNDIYHCNVFTNLTVKGPFFSRNYEQALEDALLEALNLITK